MTAQATLKMWACVLLAATLVLAVPAGAQRVIVVSSSDGAPYQQALAGIQKQVPSVEALQVAGDNDAALTGLLARSGRESLIVTLGVRASTLVARAGSSATVVNCMVLSGDDAKPPAGTLVVPLDVPIETHIAWLKRLLPKARTVGVLYDPRYNDRRAVETAAAFSRAGYQSILEAVPAPNALPAALNRLTNNTDVLHALPDTTVFAREHSRALLLFSFRNLIPLAGPNENWVRAGALYAVDWDYPDLGRYCVGLGLRQLGGGRAPPPAPAATRVIVNLRSAQQLRVAWDAETLRMVDRVSE